MPSRGLRIRGEASAEARGGGGAPPPVEKRLRPCRAEDCESEARRQRKVAAGVGPRRQWKSACGHAEPRTANPRRGVSGRSRRGWGPADSGKKMTTKATVLRLLTIVFVALASDSVRADVRSDEKTHIEFAGMLGRMMNMFGGKAAREGVTATVAVKGDRMARLDDERGQIVDLAEEKIYDLDLKKKAYRVTTFAELRRRMEEARKKAEEDAKKQEGADRK